MAFIDRFLKKNLNIIRIRNLRSSIFDKHDFILFDEAFKCFENEAYRASFIMIWICIAESLRNKFIKMSVHDDEIGRIVAQIEQLEKQDRPADKFILEKSSEVGIISPEEFKKLDHIRDMRNLYVHPTGKNPGPEEIFFSFTLAVNIVLSRPPLLRYGYVERITKSLLEERHFLDNDEDKIRQYGLTVAKRIHPEALPFLFKKLAEGIEKIFYDPEIITLKQRGLIFGSAVLGKLKPNLSLNGWDVLKIIQDFPNTTSLLVTIPELWTSLSAQVKDMAFAHLVEPIVEGEIKMPTSLGFKRAKLLSSKAMLSPRQTQKLDEVFKRAPYNILKLTGIPLKEYAGRIIDDLKSHDWYTQNPAIKGLRGAGIDECSQVDSNTQEQLGRNVLQSAEGNASESVGFLAITLNKKQVWPRPFTEGLLLETMINDNKEFRLKKKVFEEVVKIVLFHPSAKVIVERAIKEIQTSKKSLYGDIDDYDTATDIIKNTMSDLGTDNPPFLSELVSVIEESREEAILSETPS